MEKYQLVPIGVMRSDEENFRIELEPRYAEGLSGLEGFSHVITMWWFSSRDDDRSRSTLTVSPPYKLAPEAIGVFSTRSPLRPNPIALETAAITYIDRERGVVGVSFSEAFDGTPVLDLKPYSPSLDRVESPKTPGWCAHWPRSLEESADFDWSAEMSR